MVTLSQLRDDLMLAAETVEDAEQKRDNTLADLWESLSKDTLAAIVGELTILIDRGKSVLRPYADAAAAELDGRKGDA